MDRRARLRRAYHNGGVRRVVRRTVETQLLQRRRLPDAVYWPVAERYFGWLQAKRHGYERYRAPPEPFALLEVPTADVRRHTRREYPPYRRRERAIGRIDDGDWDRRTAVVADPEYDGPPASLFLAETFEESVLHRSFVAHFEDGVPWAETELLRRIRSLLADGHPRPWHECTSMEEVRTRCDELDDLFDAVRSNGFKSQRELQAREGRSYDSFHGRVLDEVTIDLGRDGQPLLVCGKHRVSMAKIIGIETVPTVVHTRHVGWQLLRDEVHAAGSRAELSARARRQLAADHPDLRDLSVPER